MSQLVNAHGDWFIMCVRASSGCKQLTAATRWLHRTACFLNILSPIRGRPGTMVSVILLPLETPSLRGVITY